MPNEFHYPAQHPISSDVLILSGESQSELYQPFHGAKLYQVTPKNIIIPDGISGVSITFIVGDLNPLNESSLKSPVDGTFYTLVHNGLRGAFPLPADLFTGYARIYFVTDVVQPIDTTLTVINYII